MSTTPTGAGVPARSATALPDYDRLASRTAPDDAAVYCERATGAYVRQSIESAVSAAERLDHVKRSLYYGKGVAAYPSQIPDGAALPLSPMVPLAPGHAVLLHGALGLATEAAELLYAVSQHVLAGRDLDTANLVEELGDLEWYASMIRRAIGARQDAVQEGNIRKLRARFPDKFSGEIAGARRDTAAEMAALDAASIVDATLVSGVA